MGKTEKGGQINPDGLRGPRLRLFCWAPAALLPAGRAPVAPPFVLLLARDGNESSTIWTDIALAVNALVHVVLVVSLTAAVADPSISDVFEEYRWI